MRSTQSIKRAIFHNRACSEPEHQRNMAKGESPQEFVFRNRSKTLDQKPKIQNSYEKPSAATRQRSKTVTSGNDGNLLNVTISGTKNLLKSESFLIHNLIPKFNFVILGLSKCGKTNLIDSITTANYKKFYQIDFVESTEQNTIHILMNGEEFDLSFFEVDTKKNDLWQSISGAGYIILYNADNESSILNAVDVMYKVREQTRKKNNSELIILVGNKHQLLADVRRHALLEKAKIVAKQNLCKFVEISLDSGQNIDMLMAIILKHVTANGTCHESFHGKTMYDHHQHRNDASPKVGCANFSNASKNFMNKVLTNKKMPVKPSKSFEDLRSIKLV